MSNKRNLTTTLDIKVKLNKYTGYVVPIAVYASQTLLSNNTNLHELKIDRIWECHKINIYRCTKKLGYKVKHLF